MRPCETRLRNKGKILDEPTEGALEELLGLVALGKRYEKKKPCQTPIGSARQQATGLAAGRGRGRSSYRLVFNNCLCCHRQSSIRTHGYNK